MDKKLNKYLIPKSKHPTKGNPLLFQSSRFFFSFTAAPNTTRAAAAAKMEPQLPTIKNVFVNETDDDDPPALSSQALAALKEFLEEQRQSLANHETAENGEGTLEPESEVALVTEDWRLSQFWYDPETARTLSQEVLSLCSHSNYKVACIACPTLYAYLKVILSKPYAHFTSSFDKNVQKNIT